MDIIKTKIELSQEFIDQVKEEIKPHWGELGWVTYKRTYARWIPELGRTENWDETVKRVIEGNINLDPRLQAKTISTQDYNELVDEAKNLFKLVYGLSATPSGRNLWISGTPYQDRNGDALNNCWFIAVRPQKYGDSRIVPEYLDKDTKAVSMPYSFMFDQLMKGGGVGFSVVPSNIEQIPAVDVKTDLTILIGKDSASYDESIKAGAVDRDEWLANNDVDAGRFYKMPDSREGWVVGNATMIDNHFSETNPENTAQVVLDITDIRAKGEKIKGFGGTASGPVPLIEMLQDINELLNDNFGKKLSSVDATDIGNMIGKTVVAGNVRRSAELALGGAEDQDFITMKQDKDKLYHHRWASNNSVAVDSMFNDYQPIADSIQHNGEPGIVNLDLSQHYGRIIDGYNEDADPEVEGTNPCGEISLSNGEPCNLFEIFPQVASEQGWNLEEAFALAARYTKRVTFSTYDWEVSRNAIAKNRRIGVSMSGIQDWILTNFGHRVVTDFEDAVDSETGETYKKPIYDPEIVKEVEDMYQSVVDADKEYSDTLHCNTSVKHTTVKPSGTVAKLAGVSEGMHFHYSNYLIQRIRFQDTDPLLPALKACGYKIEPDVYTKNTMCVEFPVKAENADSDNFASAGNVSIAEQFATQAFLQTYWSDNAVSCTVTFQPEEGKEIAPLMRQYRHITKSTSLLPYSGDAFEQAPKEPISKAKYLEKLSEIHGDVATEFAKENDNHDKKDLDLVDQSDCASGACPIR
ncbi:ribonucleoside-triphosphate reductase, adenosylcobalamin-dependent [Companilactobacillus sp.]|jgi:ribonucleoside-triphosphate reductase|uniref:ribonucleoside-triphosphate reductase, adenosylcobalamin-dependent n=1 Tax=Companilactobacillus sp. TaxID=2767905 RepID=UPI0025C276D6|nr:ribonucleoside-triphosphate reductase, adenosylcobalamin-dependent [Companilactobacillus sp.]MCH4008851.1 ribonucleoside-triphosphate reductase, adenosylcobalamin-dependent [Companilactobacillus sp.]MCH4050970.1 ribonucleoside-triphosphate reductase, adenosylcobalamin-dependent [Companilactobacillus sp.]MCH4076794.1 ribonucleoside-triphosphate reductase, adenosylcobalamin-dependent [Companilactobacillus sp.]MCH4125369.1 ribonucleoside-triphosphate reductase, adenosylcobalamin-dependent [Comp